MLMPGFFISIFSEVIFSVAPVNSENAVDPANDREYPDHGTVVLVQERRCSLCRKKEKATGTDQQYAHHIIADAAHSYYRSVPVAEAFIALISFCHTLNISGNLTINNFTLPLR